MPDEQRWRWRRNPWVGVMWGPIPVLLIIFIVALAGVMIVGYSSEW
jgi:hypothetical protein